MESTRPRVSHFWRGLSLTLVLTIAANGCAVTVKGVEQAELARLRGQEVLAIHYTAPSFLIRKTAPAHPVLAGPAVATLILLPLVIGISAAVNAAEAAEERAAGAELANEVSLEDPIVGLKERLASRLTGGAEITRIRPVAGAMDSDDLKNLKQAVGSVATVLDLKTTGWGLHFHAADPKTFVALYSVKARLIRLDQEKVLWRAEVGCADAGDRRFGIPTLDDLKADGGALLKASIAKAAENCVEPLLARFRGEQPRPPTSGPDEADDVTLAPATLAQAEASLFGTSGLVEGSRRFDAKFKDVTLTARDLARLRTMMKDATASPWRSEVQFQGTVDGVPFKAKMEKGSAGRSEFTFEGLRFDDKEQASAFLAPLQGRGVRQVKLKGVAARRPIEITLASTSTLTEAAPSPLPVAEKVDEAGPARGLVEEPPPDPSGDTTASPAPNPGASQPGVSTSTPTAPAEKMPTSVETQLQRLSNLRARGELTEDEYTTLRKRVLEMATLTPRHPAGSLTAPSPSRRSAAPGALVWPPVGSSYVLSERKSGSYGSVSEVRRVKYLGEQTWQGKKVRAFSDGSLMTYLDDQHRMLARVVNGALTESWEPYFVFADWPIRVGKWWPNRHRYSDHRWGRSFDNVKYEGQVEAFEEVRTPAGTFKAFRIAFGGESSKSVLWYSSDLGLIIKARNERFGHHYLGAGVQEIELVSYDFQP